MDTLKKLFFTPLGAFFSLDPLRATSGILSLIPDLHLASPEIKIRASGIKSNFSEVSS